MCPMVRRQKQSGPVTTNHPTRREFVQQVAVGALALGLPGGFGVSREISFDPKDLPTRPFGCTGVAVPLIGVGCGSRFCRIKDLDASVRFLNEALDSGLYYWDTAHDYTWGGVVSEERLGLVLRSRRKEVFLATKVGPRDVDEAKRHLEESLKRLQTDHLDLYQIHLVKSLNDVEKIGRKGGLYEWLRGLKEQGVTRFIGFTGHLSAEAMLAALERFEFDTVLVALDHHRGGKEPFEEKLIPAAARQGLGVSVMKVIRPREKVRDIPPEKLIRYALSVPGVSAAVIGMDSLEVLRKNVQLLRHFKPLSEDEFRSLRTSMLPFFDSEADV